MDNYDNKDTLDTREQVIELTLQTGEYKGFVRYVIRGSEYGATILSRILAGIHDGIIRPRDNPINLTLTDIMQDTEAPDEDDELWFACTLVNNDGETRTVQGEMVEIDRLIVKMEVVDCTKIELMPG